MNRRGKKPKMKPWEEEGEMCPDLPFLHFPTSCPDFPSVEPNQKPYGREPKAIGDPEQSRERWRATPLGVGGEELTDGGQSHGVAVW